MAATASSRQNPPQVLVINLTEIVTLFEEKFSSSKFQLLKAYESPPLLDQFLIANAGSVRAVLCSGASPITEALLRLLPSLRIVVAATAGLNHIDLAACRRRGIAITNSRKVFSDDGADVAVSLLIDVLRKISAADRYVRQGLWPVKGDYPLGSKLRIVAEESSS